MQAVRYSDGCSASRNCLIRTIIAEDSSRHGSPSRRWCANGSTGGVPTDNWDMSCRVAMLRMHRDRLIPLPAPRRRHSNGTLTAVAPRRNRSCRHRPRRCARREERPLKAKRSCGASTWTTGYTPLPGSTDDLHQPAARAGRGKRLRTPRDRFIGWSVAHAQVGRERRPLACGCRCALASTVLARSSRRLPRLAGSLRHRPLLLETFVQSDRFAGTSCRAANWTHVGQTQGRGKLDVHRTHALPGKTSGSTRSAGPPTLRSSGSSSPPETLCFSGKYLNTFPSNTKEDPNRYSHRITILTILVNRNSRIHRYRSPSTAALRW